MGKYFRPVALITFPLIAFQWAWAKNVGFPLLEKNPPPEVFSAKNGELSPLIVFHHFFDANFVLISCLLCQKKRVGRFFAVVAASLECAK